jgi:hypothetical protein
MRAAHYAGGFSGNVWSDITSFRRVRVGRRPCQSIQSVTVPSTPLWLTASLLRHMQRWINYANVTIYGNISDGLLASRPISAHLHGDAMRKDNESTDKYPAAIGSGAPVQLEIRPSTCL